MINTCSKCGKVINNDEQVEMLIEGKYNSIPSVNAFRLHKNSIKFIPDTLRHIECGELSV